MAKSPNGKIVKSLYLKIAYVWTRPNRWRDQQKTDERQTVNEQK